MLMRIDYHHLFFLDKILRASENKSVTITCYLCSILSEPLSKLDFTSPIKQTPCFGKNEPLNKVSNDNDLSN